MKLNLGCGNDIKEGWLNIDSHVYDERIIGWDVEAGHWPDSWIGAEEVLFRHSLEHMGETKASFLIIIMNLYRVCANGATITIIAPHPRSDAYIGDPTHVRPITPAIFSLFSKKNCAEWKEKVWPNTPLAEHLEVDFEIVSAVVKLTPYWEKLRINMMGESPSIEKQTEVENEIRLFIDSYWNVVDEQTIILKVIKQ